MHYSISFIGQGMLFFTSISLVVCHLLSFESWNSFQNYLILLDARFWHFCRMMYTLSWLLALISCSPSTSSCTMKQPSSSKNSCGTSNSIKNNLDILSNLASQLLVGCNTTPLCLQYFNMFQICWCVFFNHCLVIEISASFL